MTGLRRSGLLSDQTVQHFTTLIRIYIGSQLIGKPYNRDEKAGNTLCGYKIGSTRVTLLANRGNRLLFSSVECTVACMAL